MNPRPVRTAASSPSPTVLGLAAAAALAAVLPPAAAQADAPSRRGPFAVELFGVQGLRSDARLPNDSSATRFALDSLTGAGPTAAARIEAIWPIGARSELRGLLSPLPSGAGAPLPWLSGFGGQAFGAGADRAEPYRFDSYRLTWRYAWIDSPQLSVKLGVTARIRDTRMALHQGAASAEQAGTGLLPLLHASFERTLTDRLSLAADVDALAASQGHVVDAGMRLRYALDRDWSASVSYRILDGSVDSATLYNAARLQYLGVGLRRAF